MIEFKPIHKENYRLIYKWFESEDFFYDTHMPEIIMKKEIDNLIQYSDSYVNIIYLHKKPVGLCDFIIKNNIAKIEIQVTINDASIISTILTEYCKQIFANYDVEKISKYVYEFDKKGIILFENSVFFKEGELNRYIYKDYKYWYVVVYSILREEYLMRINDDENTENI